MHIRIYYIHSVRLSTLIAFNHDRFLCHTSMCMSPTLTKDLDIPQKCKVLVQNKKYQATGYFVGYDCPITIIITITEHAAMIKITSNHYHNTNV